MNNYTENVGFSHLHKLESFGNRSFLTLKDFSSEELSHLLELAEELKTQHATGTEERSLTGKVIALVFEKDSTRTRCAFEVAALHQGAATTYLSPGGTHIGVKESLADTARVLGGMFDAIMYRGHGQEIVETLAANAGVPVYNGLTDEFHPTQILADLLTMSEYCSKPLKEQTLVYLGDGANNMANSLMIGCAKLGVNFRIASPEGFRPSVELVEYAQGLAQESGSEISLGSDAKELVAGADFLYTDVWLSMGAAKEEWEIRVKAMMPYRVDKKLAEATGNPEVKFLHCLPAYHDQNTPLGKKFFEETGLNGIEVCDELFSSPASVVFEQSTNRLHTIKALMVATLG